MERDVEHGDVNDASPADQQPAEMDLVAQVAHDFRTPLTSILFLTDALRSGAAGAMSDDQREQLALIYTAALQLSTLANDLTDFARRGSWTLLESDAVPFSLDEIVRSVEDIVRAVAHAKGLALSFVVDAHDQRRGHPAAIARVLLNLVTNALKFTARGWVSVVVEDVDADRVRFSVRDTGPGFPAHVNASLARPSATAVKEAGEFSSSGLGLVICQRLVREMGGRLRVSSAREQGTEVTFELGLPRAHD